MNEIKHVELVIPAENAPALEAALTRLGRRAVRLGLPAPVARFGQSEVPFKTARGTVIAGVSVSLDYVVLRAAGGFSVRALVEHTTEGNVVFPLGGHKVPEGEFNKVEARCDHCNTRRSRNTTFVVCNPAGETRLIGRSCLAEYCGIDPEVAALAAQIELRVSEAPNWDDSDEREGRVKEWHFTGYVLAKAAAVIRKYGWVSRATAEDRGIVATADAVRAELRKPELPDAPEDVLKLAEEAREWAAGLEDSADDFQRNLATVARLEYIPDRFIGVAAYLTEAYNRHREKLRQAAEDARSEHQGTVGERLKGLRLTAVFTTSWDTDYGVQHLTKFVDAAGNIFVTKSGNSFGHVTPADSVTGTVKEHSVRDGVKQTVLTRVKAA